MKSELAGSGDREQEEAGRGGGGESAAGTSADDVQGVLAKVWQEHEVRGRTSSQRNQAFNKHSKSQGACAQMATQSSGHQNKGILDPATAAFFQTEDMMSGSAGNANQAADLEAQLQASKTTANFLSPDFQNSGKLCPNRPCEKINIITTITSERDNLDTIWKDVQNATPKMMASGASSTPANRSEAGVNDLCLAEDSENLRIKRE